MRKGYFLWKLFLDSFVILIEILSHWNQQENHHSLQQNKNFIPVLIIAFIFSPQMSIPAEFYNFLLYSQCKVWNHTLTCEWGLNFLSDTSRTKKLHCTCIYPAQTHSLGVFSTLILQIRGFASYKSWGGVISVTHCWSDLAGSWAISAHYVQQEIAFTTSIEYSDYFRPWQ